MLGDYSDRNKREKNDFDDFLVRLEKRKTKPAGLNKKDFDLILDALNLAAQFKPLVMENLKGKTFAMKMATEQMNVVMEYVSIRESGGSHGDGLRKVGDMMGLTREAKKPVLFTPEVKSWCVSTYNQSIDEDMDREEAIKKIRKESEGLFSSYTAVEKKLRSWGLKNIPVMKWHDKQ